MLRFCLVAFFAVASCVNQPVVAPEPARSSAGSVHLPPAPATPTGSGSRGSRPAGRDTLTPFARLNQGWNRVEGGTGTGCAHDSTFVFRVRPGAPEKVLIFLNGGGACWRARDCDPRAHPTYTMTADSANDASMRAGIFDVTNSANPVRDFTMIFVSYCTGDMHLGTRVVDYSYHPVKGAERSFAVQHQGSANVEAVLNWMYANMRSPRVVFVAGASTGAIASPVVAEQLARHYTRSRVVQLGDAAGGLRAAAIPSLLAGWGAVDYLRRDDAFGDLDSTDVNFERLYTTAMRAAPQVHYAQYNAIADEAQLSFLSLLGVKTVSLSRVLATNLAQIKSGDGWFRSYTAPGKTHTILRSAAMYTTTVDGVKFLDWLTQLIDGEDVSDVGQKLLKGR